MPCCMKKRRWLSSSAATGSAEVVADLECTDRCVCASHIFGVDFHCLNPKVLAAALFTGGLEIHCLPDKEQLQQHLLQQQQRRDQQRALQRQQRRRHKQQQQQHPHPQQEASNSSSSSSSSSESSDDESPLRYLEGDLEDLPTLKQTLNPHRKSCRTLRFLNKGDCKP